MFCGPHAFRTYEKIHAPCHELGVPKMSQPTCPVSFTICLAFRPKDPRGFEDALANLDPPPVSVDERRERGTKKKSKRKSKSKAKSSRSKSEESKKRKTNRSKRSRSRSEPCHSDEAEPPVVDKAELVKTFGESYQHLIKALPIALWPQAERHGNHSYTVNLCCASWCEI